MTRKPSHVVRNRCLKGQDTRNVEIPVIIPRLKPVAGAKSLKGRLSVITDHPFFEKPDLTIFSFLLPVFGG